MLNTTAFRKFVPAFTFGLANYVSIILFFKSPYLLFGALLGITTVFFLTTKSPLDRALFTVGALLLGLGEAIAVNFGGWSYTGAITGGVPYWIFIVWGNTAVFSYRLGEFVCAYLKLKD